MEANYVLKKSYIQHRDAFWDNAKFIMITLMVVGHFAEVFTKGQSDICRSIYIYIYPFHMPVLMFISGMFFKDKDIARKAVFYISCGYAIKISFAIVRMIEGREFGFSLLSESFIPWFTIVLGCYQIAMHLLSDVNKKYLLGASIIIACFAGYDKSIGDFLCLSRGIVFFPMFVAGTMFKPDEVKSAIQKHYKKLVPVSVLIMAIWFWVCFGYMEKIYIFRHLFVGRNPFSDEVISFGPLARLFCYFVTFVTVASVLVLVPKRLIPCVTKWGQKTLNVYYWHWIILMLIDFYFGYTAIFENGFVWKIIYLFSAIVLSVLISAIKIFDFPIELIRKAIYR